MFSFLKSSHFFFFFFYFGESLTVGVRAFMHHHMQTKHFQCSLDFWLANSIAKAASRQTEKAQVDLTCLFFCWDHLKGNSVEKSLHMSKGLKLCLFSVRSGVVWFEGGEEETRIEDWPHIQGSRLTLGTVQLVTLAPDFNSLPELHSLH